MPHLESYFPTLSAKFPKSHLLLSDNYRTLCKSDCWWLVFLFVSAQEALKAGWRFTSLVHIQPHPHFRHYLIPQEQYYRHIGGFPSSRKCMREFLYTSVTIMERQLYLPQLSPTFRFPCFHVEVVESFPPWLFKKHIDSEISPKSFVIRSILPWCLIFTGIISICILNNRSQFILRATLTCAGKRLRFYGEPNYFPDFFPSHFSMRKAMHFCTFLVSSLTGASCLYSWGTVLRTIFSILHGIHSWWVTTDFLIDPIFLHPFPFSVPSDCKINGEYLHWISPLFFIIS